MLGWLVKRVRARADERMARTREIYRYHDGEKMCSLDPGAAWFDLYHDSEVKIDSLIAIYLTPDSDGLDVSQMTPEQVELYQSERHEKWNERETARRKILDLVRKVMGLKMYSPEDETGLTLDEQEAVYSDFWKYMDDLKKKRDESRPASPPSPPSESDSSADSATSSESESSATSSSSSEAAL